MPLTDLLKGTKLTSAFSGTSGFVGIIGNILVFAVIAAMIVGVIWLFMRRRSYNIPTIILSKRSGTLKFFMDKASYSKDKATNIWDFRFKGLRETAAPPPYKILLTGVKGNNVATYFQNSAGELYPCEVEIIEPTGEETQEVEVLLPNGKTIKTQMQVAKCKMKIIEPDIALWSCQMDDKLLSTYGNKTWWDKYGNYVMFFGTATLVLVLIYLVLKKIDVVKEAAQLFRDSATYLKQSAITTPSTAP
jgi:hypothetical protein